MSLDTVTIVIGLVGGLALFLFGLDQMSDGLQTVAGSTMRTMLSRLTRNRFVGAVTGAVVTAMLQSSSVTTVLLVGFISAGLMTMAQSVAVIMGANVGTTVTAQIIAFKITEYALVPVAIGFAMQFLARRDRIRFWGQVVMGLGMIFFGMQIMGDAMEPLREYEPFAFWMTKMESPGFGIGAAAIFTGIIQSSAATTGVIIVLASQGLLSLEAVIPLVLGANIGTCVTALLAAIGKPRPAVQSALVHILFNVAGVLIWLPFLSELAELTRLVSPRAGELSGIARMAAEVPRQVANAHSIFNIANTLLFIWFVTPLAWLVRKIVPVKKGVVDRGRPQYLDQVLLTSPDLALDRARLELGRMGEMVADMVESTRTLENLADIEKLRQMDDTVDRLHLAIIAYLSELSRKDLTDAQSIELSDHLLAANYLENIGDMVETNLARAATVMSRFPHIPSEETSAMLDRLRAAVVDAVRDASLAFVRPDPEVARQVIESKEDINEMATELEEHLASRLVAEAPHRLDAFRIESEIVEYLKRVYYFAKRIAKIIFPEP